MSSSTLVVLHYRNQHNVEANSTLIKFVAAIEERYDCNICNAKVEEVTRNQHRKPIHAEKNFVNMFTERTFDQAKIEKELADRHG